MLRVFSLFIGLGWALFAALPSSTNYKLNSYGLGPGGTNSSNSTTYKVQGNLGEQANGSSSGTTYISKNGAVQAEQLNVPPAPTLDNGSNTYYNKLLVAVATGNNPTDTTYSLAVSTNNFVSTSYVQADGTLGATPVYQTYTTWGGSSGSFMAGLTPSTTYKVKVDAKQGLFTHTAYGAAATAATVAPSLTFSVSPNSTSIGSLLPGSIITSPNLTVSLTTNAVSGGGVYVSGQYSGLLGALEGHTIAAYGGNLTSTSEGFGVQVASASQTSGGPFASVSPFNGTGATVGAESTVPQRMLSSSAPVVGGTATTKLLAKAAALTPAGGDYQEVLTFIASANF